MKKKKTLQDAFLEEQILHRDELKYGAAFEQINHPQHYTQGDETSEYIISWGMDFLEGNVIKYVTRYKFKHGVDDLKKAKWYLERLIKQQEEKHGRV
tara:strand:- start:416 stop:706 length:291 start_codon:yes stop_codon:yes gene_type:complete